MGVTVKSDGSDGKHVEITLDKTGPDTGKVTAKTWNGGANQTGNPPDKDEVTKLYSVQAKIDGLKIVCKADVSGPDPDVTFDLAGPTNSSVTVTIEGTFLGIGDSTTTYNISQLDFLDIKTFVSAAGFPPLT